MNLKQQTYKTVAAWMLLALFMATTRPSALPVVGLIVPFVLLYGALYCSWRLVGELRARYRLTVAEPTAGRRFGVVVCLSIVLMTILQSLGQLTVRDVATIGAIFVIGYLYIARNRVSPPKQ
jgi:phosphoglycerol transferase MdoB-like AlkP superfamily enzyme